MGQPENVNKASNNSTSSPSDPPAAKNKSKNQGKKRKRSSSTSSNGGDEMILPDNALETERNVHISAVKNNLDETSVRKIIKKVVTNDHVLALVKLREEEENASADDKTVQPKLTRAKVKELKKVSPKTAWNLENLELTPIKHIPVKTRPEVKALIAQELPEDEDDEEYEPTHDDVLSEDEQTLESCSDADSQPRTPATPAAASPRPLHDGPFKVPQNVSSARRKLNIEEEATIALRTRSKLSLSETPIEHIEATFVPPDDIPMQDVDDLWNQFLNECLNPASTSRNEDDDETDPEYNVAADPDAQDEDEEGLGNSIIKISKKELNDLVTELFNIIPATDEDLAENLANSVLTDNTQNKVHCEAKQEPQSDEECHMKPSQRLTFEKNTYPISIGKSEPEDLDDVTEASSKPDGQSEKENQNTSDVGKPTRPHLTLSYIDNKVHISVEQRSESEKTEAPPSLRSKLMRHTDTVHIQIESAVTMTAEQRVILQQQARQHVQLAATNFLQLYVHPVYWKLAPAYKEYLESLAKLVEKNKDSAVSVCNLNPALELVAAWERRVSEDTPDNWEMIEFIQGQVDRNRRRAAQNSLYAGNFHEKFLETVANSTVFLYPHLLPAMPYRPDKCRRNYYLPSEDRLIVLGLDQFRSYVEANPKLFRVRSTLPRARRGLSSALELFVKHIMPWSSVKAIARHIHSVNSLKDESNPIYRYFKYNEVPKISHKLLACRPRTLYEQPEHEMPRAWVRYLARRSRRFKTFLYKRVTTLNYPKSPEGISIEPGVDTETTTESPLPNDYTKEIVAGRTLLHQVPNVEENPPQNNTKLVPYDAQNVFKLVQTSTGSYLLPLATNTQTVNSNSTPITTPAVRKTRQSEISEEHCTCCKLLRKLTKKQKLITDYFGDKQRKCDCIVTYPRITKRLRMLVRNHKNVSEFSYHELERLSEGYPKEDDELDVKELAYVLKYQLKVFSKASMSRRIYVKKQVYNALASFDLDAGDPIKLADKLFKAYDVELVDLYMDFLGFLNPEQVDKMKRFKEYFTRNCAQDLMEKVEEQVKHEESRNKMLYQIKTIYTDSESTACEMCTGLMKTMEGYPQLAQYTFNMFPHRKEDKKENRTKQLENNDAMDQSAVNDSSHEVTATVDYYEADHSSNGEDSDNCPMEIDPLYIQPENGENQNNIKIVVVKEEPTEVIETKYTLEFSETSTKNEDEDIDSEPSLSINIAEIKTESPDWRREEDKLILEVLQHLLTPEERKDKTVAVILRLLEEKNVYLLISESLDRPIEEIKERLLYLLSLLVMSESCDT